MTHPPIAVRAAPPGGASDPAIQAIDGLAAAACVTISKPLAAEIAHIAAAIEAAASLPDYRARARALAAAEGNLLAEIDHGPLGAFLGLDFHVAGDGPKLVEINTNAGGALVVAALARAYGVADPCAAEAGFIDMFRAEWRRQKGNAPLAAVAIVDDDPERQFMRSEFEMFKNLFARHGIRADIVDARTLVIEGRRLIACGHPVDLVYNRLTDFALAAPEHAALARAYGEGLAVVTPNPHAHALRADKRLLAILGDLATMRAMGLDDEAAALLARVIPRTRPIADLEPGQLWSARRELFFKPFTGYGSRGVYRGDKLTRKVWSEIVTGGRHVVQDLAPPGIHRIGADGSDFKLDLRAYAYDGRVLSFAARLYRGQATNFRTPGGGFAPVAVEA